MLLHKITKILHEKDYFFLLLRFLSPSPSTPLLPVTVARTDLLPPATMTQAKTTQVKPQLRPTYRSLESTPRTVGIARTAASAARSACVVCLRSGIPPLRWTSSSSASLREAPWWPNLRRDGSEQLWSKSTNWTYFLLVRAPFFSFDFVPNHRSF